MKNILAVMVFAAVSVGTASAHHDSGTQSSAQTQAPVTGQKVGMGTGLIQQIDKERGAVTIKHGPLQGLNMPGMTMSFLVKDKSMLATLQPQQKVDFELTYDGKNYLITRIK